MNKYKYRIALSGFIDAEVEAETQGEAELKALKKYNNLNNSKDTDFHIIQIDTELVEWESIENGL